MPFQTITVIARGHRSGYQFILGKAESFTAPASTSDEDSEYVLMAIPAHGSGDIWIRSCPSWKDVVLRFLDYMNCRVRPDGTVEGLDRIQIYRHDLWRTPSYEEWRRIGGR